MPQSPFPAIGGKSGRDQALESMLAMLEGSPVEESREARAAEKSFHEFVRQAWPTVEPGTPFRDGWYVGCVAEHLQAVTAGEIKNLIINTPFRHGKPVHVDAMVLMGDGSRKRLGDVSVGDLVMTHIGRARKVLAVHPQGLQPCLRLITFDGRTTVAARTHPFLTPQGWKAAEDLRIGEALAVVSRPVWSASRNYNDAEFRLAGYFVGDGCTASSGGSFFANITSADPDYIREITRDAGQLGFIATVVEKKKSSGAVTINLSGGVRPWLESIGLDRKTSYTKRVPEFIFRGSSAQISQFLAAYFHCDGTISRRGKYGKGSFVISFCSVSMGLLKDVQHLLVRLGIAARLRKRQNRSQNNKWMPPDYVWYQLDITREDESSKFFERVPLFGRKRDRLAGYKPARHSFDGAYLADLLDSVEDVGQQECVCLTVEEDSSFTADDLVVHNSLLASVMWFAWTWITRAHLRFIYTSYSAHLSERDQKASRNLIMSPWYQNRWGNRFKFRQDQNTSNDFRNSHGGFRIATSMGGFGLGEGGHIVVSDDPVNTTDAVSKAYLMEAIRAWTQTFSTRFTGTYDQFRKIVMMQRIAENDLSGYLIAERLGYDTLILPAEYEPHRYWLPPALRPQGGDQSSGNGETAHQNGRSRLADLATQARSEKPPRDAIVPTRLQLRRPELLDPRKEAGELLWPERFTREDIESLKASVKHGWAGQGQQRPAPEEGDLYKRQYFRYYEEIEADAWVDGIPTLERAYLIEPVEEGSDPDIALHRHCRIFQTCDTAMKRDQRSDETVVLTWALAPVMRRVGTSREAREEKVVKRYLLLLGIWHARIEIPFQWDSLKAQREAWPGLLFQGVENRASGTGLIQQAILDGVPMVPLEPGQIDKVARAAVSVILYGQRLVCHRRGMPDLNWLEDQLLVFPAGAHDDAVDCVSYAGRLFQTDQLLNAGMSRELLLSPDSRDHQERIASVHGETYQVETPSGEAAVYFPEEGRDWDSYFGR